ncbi:hypothetical protein [Streptomyces sp. NPDC088789]|uniref:hypothetical protein n=1 Tax=Streptomyces sp. NPDC088789 TaxID=3365899 RepID=UPI0038281BCE
MLRLLPVAFPPVQGETIGSYLHRLADANHLPVRYLAGLLDVHRHHRRDDPRADHWTPQALHRLSILTGRPAANLTHAMPSLADHTQATGTPTHPGSRTRRMICRPACRDCTARRNIHGLVVRETPAHEAVCHRHQRWLLGDDQHRLHGLQDVQLANRKHRRVASRTNATIATRHYSIAAECLAHWLTKAAEPQLQKRWMNRLHVLGEDPYGDPTRPSAARIEITTYPETVTLTGLIMSKHWRTHPDLASEITRRLRVDAGVDELAAFQKLTTSLRTRLDSSQSD